MTATKTARWLDLVAFLLDHRFPVTREQIFEKVSGYTEGREDTAFESARRKFERDKDELRALGIEIETLSLPDAGGAEPQIGYRLKPGNFYLPYFEIGKPGGAKPYRNLPLLTLTADEVAILDRATRRLAQRTEFPLAASITAARRKLAFDLPLDPDTIERILAAPMPEAGRHALATLQSAVAHRLPVACHYHALTSDADERLEIEPYGLFFHWSHWYCVAHVRDTETVRAFRVDRLSETTHLENQIPFEVPRDFDVRAYMVRAPWEVGAGQAITVRVRFQFPEGRWVVNRGLGQAVEPVLDDGGSIVEFTVRDRDGFLRWLLTFRRQATVLEPADVAREMEALRQRVAALYGGSGD